MNLKQWAASQGVHPQTAYRWLREGKLPVPATKVGHRTVLVGTPTSTTERVALYARVSSHDQAADLERQRGRLVAWAAQRELTVVRTEAEVGSGMNGRRPKLRRLLADATVSCIVVEHRDRLARFGAEYVEAALAAQGRRVLVVDDAEVADDLVRDMTEVLTSMCARLYGRRSARTRAQRALRCAAQPVPSDAR